MRQSKLAWQRHCPGGVALYAVDPGLELEDKFAVSGDSVSYRVESISVSLQKSNDSPRASARMLARRVPSAAVTGVYDTATFDSDIEYASSSTTTGEEEPEPSGADIMGIASMIFGGLSGG